MLSRVERTDIKKMSREEWLAVRRRSIGGSDAAAIVGLNEWSSPYHVWADKTGRLPPQEETEAMRLGRDLETYVASRFTEVTGKQVRRVNSILQNMLYPFAHANVDRMIVGENAGLEVKTTSALNMKRFMNGEYPASYYVQCTHYMAVTGAKKWYLAVLVLNKDFLVLEIERNEDEISALMQAEAEFWHYVESDTPPPVDGSDVTTETISTIFAESDRGAAIDLFGREKLLDEYMALTKQKDELECAIDTIKQTLMSDMGEAETGYCGDYRVTWKKQTRRTFDAKAYKEEHPDLDVDDYYNVSAYRVFKITEDN